ncbi:MAG: peroxidase [Armatimonadetes bacterium]|nr:peroxidase [Armatimonadota bacterium]
MSDAQITPADYADIQGVVLNGYGSLKCTRFLFLQIGDAAAARRWLGELRPQITTGARRPKDDPKPETALNVAFTHPGLQMLGLPPDALAQFPREFQEGMADGERSRVLGDTGDSAPAHWDLGGPATPVFHVLLMLYGRNDDVILARTPALEAQFRAAGLTEVFRQDTGRISNREPFGFADGISQPFPAGSPGSPIPGEVPINAGEFLLGYRNGYGTLPPSPMDAQGRDFGRNGTYLIFRKLAQDVSGFWRFMEQQTRRADGNPDEARKVRLAAKIVGRWPGGAPLVLAPDADDPALHTKDKGNQFSYMPTDPDGLACPIGAHIRRSNPRDSLLPTPARSLVIANRHRLIRRGRHYEDHRADAVEGNGVEHGLCFLALNADIQRQFEFIQQTWINSPKFRGLYDNKDALVGDNDGTSHMTIPALPVRQRINNLPRFVRVRGGGYFFLPGLSALRFLSGGA